MKLVIKRENPLDKSTQVIGSSNVCEVIRGNGRAMKVIRSDCIDILVHEYEILKQIDHPNIIKLASSKPFHVLKDSNKLGLQLELGHIDLFHFLKQTQPARLNTPTVKAIFRNLADALVYLHEAKRIAHNDIKLENILLFFSKQKQTTKSTPPPPPQLLIADPNSSSQSASTAVLSSQQQLMEEQQQQLQVKKEQSAQKSQADDGISNSNNDTKIKPKLIDFGLASTATVPCSAIFSNWQNRSPNNLPPEIIEQLNGECASEESFFDLSKCDVFQFGLTLFNALFLSNPFFCEDGNSSYDHFIACTPESYWESAQVQELLDVLRSDTDEREIQQIIDLMNLMFRYSPSDRPTMRNILEHPWFSQ